jgi:hypothetical protein
MTPPIIKYPRTRHIADSRLQPGDEDDNAPLTDIVGRHTIFEEKLDGANSGISFDDDANLLIQSRGHYLTGGWRERHWSPLKAWAAARQDELFDILSSRYVMYGEWMYATHGVYYDLLPHYFMEFDILDRETGRFLSTDERHRMLAGSSVVSVPVVHRHDPGDSMDAKRLKTLVRHSVYKSPDWRNSYLRACERAGVDPAKQQGIDPSDLSEGLYIKVEEDGGVVARYKWVRPDFLQAVLSTDTHWIDRPIVPNALAPGVDIMAAPHQGGRRP